MNNRTLIIIGLCIALGAALLPQASEAGTLRRYLLAVGANDGGPERVTLKYAVSDAQRFSDIMVRMGGVEPADRIVLENPDAAAVTTALSNLASRVPEGARDGRTEILFYYSGHADESGLRIGNDHVPYSDLRASIEGIAAGVRITVLDACASGAITRIKGGERRQPFLVDDASDMKGYAFLTSSSGDEAAQESDAIGASYFTHFLVSGLRGAADLSGDGTVSLTEAYQFAFNETLNRTTETMGGAQHPSYHINLSGTGDVVMTDVRRTSAGLVLEKDLQGRFYIRDADQHLVAELYKPRGRRMVLGMEAGRYQIHLEGESELFVASIELGLDETLVLTPENFQTADRAATVARGKDDTWPPKPGFIGPLAGRNRIALIIGKNEVGVGGDEREPGLVSATAETVDLTLGIGYTRWVREDLGFNATLQYLQGDFATDVGTAVVSHAASIVSVGVGAQKTLPASLLRTPMRPYLALGVGVLIASDSRSGVENGIVSSDSKSMGAFGVAPGMGVDFVISRRIVLGAKAAYSFVTDFAEPLAGKDNYSGWEFDVSVGWLWGKGFEG